MALWKSRIWVKISFSKSEFCLKTVFRKPNFAENQFFRIRVLPKISFLKPEFCRKSVIEYEFSSSLAILEKHGRNDIIPEAIVLAQLSWHTYQNILRWWNGQISGQRCVKNIIDDVATVTGGICGATLGGTIGNVRL